VSFQIALVQRASKLAPSDAQVRLELVSLRAQIASQRRKDQASFGGLFERGEIFEEENVRSSFETAGAASSSAAVGGSSSSATGASASASSGATPSAASAVSRTKEFLSEYLTGVQELARKEQEAKQQQKRPERRSDDASAPSAASASSAGSSSSSAASLPSDASLAALYADARSKFGLDLSDPLVQEELRRMQEHHKRTGEFAPPPPEADETAAGDAAAAAEQAQSSGRAHSVRSNGPVKAAVTPTDLSSSGWLGPLLFSLIFAAALRWMRIL